MDPPDHEDETVTAVESDQSIRWTAEELVAALEFMELEEISRADEPESSKLEAQHALEQFFIDAINRNVQE